jgi:hypothetical protein
MATLIATSTAGATSADIVLASGASATLSLVNGNAGDDVCTDAVAQIQVKSAGGNYFTIGQLDFMNKSLVLSATGTFRVLKPLSALAYGVENN